MEWVLQCHHFVTGEWRISAFHEWEAFDQTLGEAKRFIFNSPRYRIVWEDGTIEMGNEV